MAYSFPELRGVFERSSKRPEMCNRNEVPIACYFPKRGSGGLLFSGAQGLIVFERSSKRRTDGYNPPSGARNTNKSGVNSF